MGADLTVNKAGTYFRDSYNNSSLLWQYDLSWWTDVTSILVDGNADPSVILAMMDRNKRDFELNIEMMRNMHNKHLDYQIQPDSTFKHVPDHYEPRETVVDYYLKKDKEFRKYLQDAIDAGNTISCSL